jgi:hypothetical protein
VRELIDCITAWDNVRNLEGWQAAADGAEELAMAKVYMGLICEVLSELEPADVLDVCQRNNMRRKAERYVEAFSVREIAARLCDIQEWRASQKPAVISLTDHQDVCTVA